METLKNYNSENAFSNKYAYVIIWVIVGFFIPISFILYLFFSVKPFARYEFGISLVFFIFLFACAFTLSARRRLETPWFLRLAVLSLPLPWLASELGWFVAEYGRQPWVIEGVLPTYLGTSTLSPTDLYISLAGFALFYTGLAVVELYLMIKYIRLGPEGMHLELTKAVETTPIQPVA